MKNLPRPVKKLGLIILSPILLFIVVYSLAVIGLTDE